MKTEVHESEFGLFLIITPENVVEVSQLARYAINANSKKPVIAMEFYGEPYLSISLGKRKKSVQKFSIRPQ